MPTEEATYRKSIDEKLDLILAQTTKHNGRLSTVEGRLTVVEKWVARSEGFGSAVNTGWTTIVTVVSGAISGLIVYWLTRR